MRITVADPQLRPCGHWRCAHHASIVWRMRPRARCSSTRWFSTLMPNSWQASSGSRPSMPRSMTTARWPAGRCSMAFVTWSRDWRPSTIRSGLSSSRSSETSRQQAPGREPDHRRLESLHQTSIGVLLALAQSCQEFRLVKLVLTHDKAPTNGRREPPARSSAPAGR